MPSRVAYPGEELTAPGVLKNPVRVEALYDPEAANDATLRDLLQRRGYADLDAVREEGHRRGQLEGLRSGVRDLREVLGIKLTPERDAALAKMSDAELLDLRDHLKRERRWP